MPDPAYSLSEEIIEISRAFTQTLRMENTVFQEQLNGAVELTVNAFKELIVLCKEAIDLGSTGKIAQGQQNLARTTQQALSDVQQAAGPDTGTDASSASNALPAAVTEAVLDQAALRAIAISYQNAVAAQQQMYMLQQATLTNTITTISSIATATIAIAVKEAETQDEKMPVN